MKCVNKGLTSLGLQCPITEEPRDCLLNSMSVRCSQYLPNKVNIDHFFILIALMHIQARAIRLCNSSVLF